MQREPPCYCMLIPFRSLLFLHVERKDTLQRHASLNQLLLRGQGEGKLIKVQHIRSLWVKRPLASVCFPSQKIKDQKTYTLFSMAGKTRPIVVKVHVCQQQAHSISQVDTGASLNHYKQETLVHRGMFDQSNSATHNWNFK